MEEQHAREVVQQLEGFEEELDTFLASVENRMPTIQVIPSIESTVEKLRTLKIEAHQQLETARQSVPA